MRMRAVLGAIAAGGAVLTLLTTAPAPAACTVVVKWRGVVYHGSGLESPVRLGRDLRGGVIPGCDDVIAMDENGQRVNEPPPDEPVALVRVRRVDPRVAVARRGQRRSVYLAPGFLIGLPSHPLHLKVFGRRIGDESATYRCTHRSTRVEGTVPWQPAFGIRFAVGPSERATDIAVDGLTRVSGRTRAGLPYVEEGDRLVVEGLECRAAYANVLARSIHIIPGG